MQYTDESMSVEVQTKGFGLRMNSDKVFEVVEKMDESEVFWDMKYVQYSPKNEIDYALNLKVNPIKLVYEGTFVKFLVNFFTNDSDLQIQEQAAEKWVDFKEGAQQQIQESMKAGRNDIKIEISSPILLIPLRHNDRDSNLWAINLGDFSVSSENTKKDYECYSFNITSVMFKFYDRYEIWKKFARQEMMNKKKLSEFEIDRYSIQPTFDSDNFTLLEDFSIESKLAINKSSITETGKENFEVVVKATPVVFNINKVIYNHLVNIHRCFVYQNPEKIASDMIEVKQDILK